VAAGLGGYRSLDPTLQRPRGRTSGHRAAPGAGQRAGDRLQFGEVGAAMLAAGQVDAEGILLGRIEMAQHIGAERLAQLTVRILGHNVTSISSITTRSAFSP
jgi:ribosomal protein L16/L10AE